MKILIIPAAAIGIVFLIMLMFTITGFISEFRNTDGPTEPYTWKMACAGPSDWFEPDFLGVRWGRALRVYRDRRQKTSAT